MSNRKFQVLPIGNKQNDVLHREISSVLFILDI